MMHSTISKVEGGRARYVVAALQSVSKHHGVSAGTSGASLPGCSVSLAANHFPMRQCGSFDGAEYGILVSLSRDRRYVPHSPSPSSPLKADLL